MFRKIVKKVFFRRCLISTMCSSESYNLDSHSRTRSTLDSRQYQFEINISDACRQRKFTATREDNDRRPKCFCYEMNYKFYYYHQFFLSLQLIEIKETVRNVFFMYKRINKFINVYLKRLQLRFVFFDVPICSTDEKSI